MHECKCNGSWLSWCLFVLPSCIIINNLLYFQIHCGNCKHPLGHQFLGDGPKGKSRFWIFSDSLKFVPSKLSCPYFSVLYTYLSLCRLSYFDETISGYAWVWPHFWVDTTRLWHLKMEGNKLLTKSFLWNLRSTNSLFPVQSLNTGELISRFFSHLGVTCRLICKFSAWISPIAEKTCT